MIKMKVIINSNYLNKKFFYFKNEKKKYKPFTRRNVNFECFQIIKI